RTEACTRVDLRRRLPRREADQVFKGQNRGPAVNPACAKTLDWNDPVTEVLTLTMGRITPNNFFDSDNGTGLC
ncbi:hypothetical protein, partial [Pseudotabrizicola alkalilacus]|uniref:hypothetical protein n=1 Tax=Pseudotabrizicola alkalilacus TaxID=2305252 RepID=UPI001F3F2422